MVRKVAFAGRAGSRIWLSALLVAVVAGGSSAAALAAGTPSRGRALPRLHPVAADQAFAQLRGKGYEGRLARARRHALTLPVRRPGSPARGAQAGLASTTWQPLGPAPENSANDGIYGGPNSGRVTGLALGGSTIYAAAAGGGVWSSANGGTSWATHTDSQSDIAMGAVAVDPSNSSVVFGGTGEDNACLDCFYGDGVLESTDGGSTWTRSNPGGMFTGVDIASIAVEPGASSLSSTIVWLGTSNGLYESKNGGSTWSAVISGTNVYSVVLNPNVSGQPDRVYAAVTGTGVDESKDNGTSFTTVMSETTANANGALAIHPGTTDATTTLYVSWGSFSGYVGMDKSTDGGASWNPVTVPYYTGDSYAYDCTSGDSGDQSWYDNAIAIDPANANIVVAAGITAIETTDGGTTWTSLDGGSCFYNIDPGSFHPDFHAVVFDSSDNLYLGDDGGVYELPAADVSGASFSPSNFKNLNTNLDITQFYPGVGAVGSGGKPTTVLGGAQDNGSDLYSSSATTPTTWKMVSLGDGGGTAIDPSNTLTQYAEEDISVGGSLVKTTNGWASSSDVSNPCTAGCNWAPQMVIVPNTSGPTILFGGDYVYESTNGGTNWTALGTATSHHGTDAYSYASAIAVAPSSHSVIYAGYDDGTLQMSTTGGSSWTTLSPPAGGLDITHIAVSPTNPYTIYVTLAFTYSGIDQNSSGPAVLVGSSLNGTASWSNVSGNLPSGVPTNSVIPNGAGGLYVADDTGVFEATSLSGSTTSWSRLGTGLPGVQVMDLTLTPDGALVAATHGRGAWTLNVSSGSGPVVAGLSPSAGPTAGGTSVTITGSGFTGATGVKFGSLPATSYTVKSASQIVATSPAEAAGTVDVRVTTSSGTSATGANDKFSYDPVPAVSGIAPSAGPTSGGTSVTVTGSGFTGATAVKFGSTSATSYTVESATKIVATAPAEAVGTVDVTVKTPGGTSATGANDKFSYDPVPAVSGILPTSGPTAGGTSVTIMGSGFTGATAVKFGSVAATSYTVESATKIVATAPAEAVGTVDVTVKTPGGTSAAGAGDEFSYDPVPVVSSVSPSSGSAGGGNSVTISGSGFTGATAVQFGAIAATLYTVESPTKIMATAPAEAAGTIDVTVTTPGGTSATGAPDRYTYTAPAVQLAGNSAFGDQTVGTASGPRPFTVTNTGNGLLSISDGGVALVGADQGQYLLSNDGCSGQQVLPGFSCTVDVSFLPTSAGSHGSAMLQVSDDAAGSPQAVQLSGTGISAVTPLAAPTISKASQSHARWREGKALATISAVHRHRPPVGTTFSFSLNESAQVSLVFSELLPGRKAKGGKCVAPTKRNRHARKCVRTVSRGTLTLAGHSGLDRVSFDGLLAAGKKLPRGKYTVVILATTAAAQQAQSNRLGFTIVK